MRIDSRRTLLKVGFLSAAMLIMAKDTFIITPPKDTLTLVQSDLFPYADELGVDVVMYMKLILNHSHVRDEDKLFIRNGVRWLNEEAILKYDKIYTKLSQKQRQNVLKIISKERWGESWIESMLKFIMEAMFSDKIYGVNRDENGQKWVNHTIGLPRPKKAYL